MIRGPRLPWLVSAMALAMAPAAHAVGAKAATALVIGVGGAGDCRETAKAVALRLRAQGHGVATLVDPTSIEFRGALNNLADALDEPGSDGALIYVCAPAVRVETRLFALPAGADPASAPAQGVVFQALLNTLAVSGGMVFADLGIEPPSSSTTTQATRRPLPSGVHMALGYEGRGGQPKVGHMLGQASFRIDDGWDALSRVLSASQPPDRVVVAPPGQPISPAPTVPPAPNPPSFPAEAEAPSAPAFPSLPPAVGASASASATTAQPPPPTNKTNATRTAAPVHDRRPPRARQAEPPRDNSDSRISRLQQALARRDMYGGPIDGRVDGGTKAAIRAFQRTLGTPETGVLTQSEIVRLLND